VRGVLDGRESVYRHELEHDDAAFPGGRGWTGVTIVALGEGDKAFVLVELTDVTGRKLAQINEAALRESEARFRSLAEMSSDWYWQQDAQFRLTFFSGDDVTEEVPFREATFSKAPWELPDRLPLEGTWAEHRALLDAHQPFRNFVYVWRPEGLPATFISVNGHPTMMLLASSLVIAARSATSPPPRRPSWRSSRSMRSLKSAWLVALPSWSRLTGSCRLLPTRWRMTCAGRSSASTALPI
jgi:hypothetical protein